MGSNPSRSASHRMKPFADESARASDRADSPRPRSCAIQDRMSETVTRESGPSPEGSPWCIWRNDRKARNVCPVGVHRPVRCAVDRLQVVKPACQRVALGGREGKNAGAVTRASAASPFEDCGEEGDKVGAVSRRELFKVFRPKQAIPAAVRAPRSSFTQASDRISPRQRHRARPVRARPLAA